MYYILFGSSVYLSNFKRILIYANCPWSWEREFDFLISFLKISVDSWNQSRALSELPKTQVLSASKEGQLLSNCEVRSRCPPSVCRVLDGHITFVPVLCAL